MSISTAMELLFLSLLLTLFLFISFHAFARKHKRETGLNLPPGKLGWPFIGETLEFLSTGRKGMPEKFINDRTKTYSPQVFKTSILAEEMAVFCGPKGNKFLFSNENTLVTVWFPQSLQKIFPSTQQTYLKEESAILRKFLPGFLGLEALQRYVGVMDTIAKRHLETSWDLNDEVKVFPLVKRYTFLIACRLFLSIEDPDHVAKFAAPFLVLVAGVFSIPIDFPGTACNRAIKAAEVVRKEILAIIKQRKIDMQENSGSMKHDILSHMLTMTDDNGQLMNDSGIADKIIALLIGGHDTATAALTFTMKYLAELPNVYNEILEEQVEIAASKKHGELLNWKDIQKMRYTWNVVNEVMRLAPPVQGTFREALTNLTYAGFSIPKGWKLYWSANSTHKNPDYFPEPEKFDPSRFEGTGPAPYTFVPFGGGPRMCPGKEYARFEILVFLHNVVRRFRWEKLLPNEKIIINPLPKPEKGLPIRLISH